VKQTELTTLSFLACQRRYEISFGQIYLSKTTMTESDGTVAAMFPQEARLRNLT
jgi:DNA-directed RNA polymerase II subunit RPB2